MSGRGKRVQMIPTSMDLDRIRESLIERQPDRVYILYNKDPVGVHEDLNDDVLEEAKKLVRQETMCYRRDEVEEVGIEYYQFDQVMADVFGLMYEESQKGNQVFVNVAGGTKPVAIALAYCSSIIDSGIPLYYIAEDYSESESVSNIESTGVVETTFQVSPLPSLDLTDLLPDDEDQEFILSELTEYTEFVGVKDLLVDADIIDEQPPDDSGKRDRRESTLQSYHRIMGHLLDDGIVKKNDSKYKLTDNGELIAKLVEERDKVDQKIQIPD